MKKKMAVWLDKLKMMDIKKKAIILLCIFFFIEFLVFAPVLYSRLMLNGMGIKNLVSAEYVKYENELFRSVVLEMRETTDKVILKEIEALISDGKVLTLHLDSEVQEVLILKTAKGNTIYVYVQDDVLGCDYGSIYVKNEKSREIIEKMPEKELVIEQIR